MFIKQSLRLQPGIHNFYKLNVEHVTSVGQCPLFPMIVIPFQ